MPPLRRRMASSSRRGDHDGVVIGSYDPAIDELGHIESASAAMVTFSFRARIHVAGPRHRNTRPPRHAVVGEGSMMVTAVTFLDRKWPRLRRDEDVLLRAHVGRSDDARWSELNDDELIRRVSNELAVLLPKWILLRSRSCSDGPSAPSISRRTRTTC